MKKYEFRVLGLPLAHKGQAGCKSAGVAPRCLPPAHPGCDRGVHGCASMLPPTLFCIKEKSAHTRWVPGKKDLVSLLAHFALATENILMQKATGEMLNPLGRETKRETLSQHEWPSAIPNSMLHMLLRQLHIPYWESCCNEHNE